MRFAYIDSQGKEVGIPSVEALGLRIELGAITPSTELYDATADRWAPASEHEVFRTLSREIQEKGEGFVAPLPPSRPERPRSADPFEMLDGPTEEDAAPPPEDPAEIPPADPSPASAEAKDEGFDLGFDLTLAPEEEAPSAPLTPPEAAPEPPPSREEAAGGFDFGDLGALEVEGSPEDPAFSDDGLELEDVLSASYGDEAEAEPPAAPARGPASMWDDHEEPGEERPDDLPSWAREEEETTATPPRDLDPEAEEARLREEAERRRAAARARFDDGGEVPGARAQGARGARSRPPPRAPARPPRSGMPAGLVWGAVLLGVAGAGWFGWSRFQEGRAAGAQAAAEAPVPIPQIPAELEPRYRALADVALQATLRELRALPEARGLPSEPPQRWLSGEYMSSAGDFPGVPAYFVGLLGYLDDVRATDSTTFSAAFAAALDSAAVGAEEAEVLRRRAAAGFSAAGGERRVAYAAFQDVIDATTSLHQFLLDNQDRIEYAPAGTGVSRDPVLEAVPSSPAIGDEMWGRVDEITAALDALGALDRVTTERLVDVLMRRVEAAGVR